MSLELRPAQPVDLPAIVRLMNFAFRGTGPNASWNTEAAFIDGNRTSEADLEAELAAKPRSHLLVFKENADSPIQGCVWLEPVSDGTWYLGSLTVDPLLQNSGLGRVLLESAEQWAKERGATTIEMKVVNVRDTLIAWYQRRGYRLTGETQQFPYGDNRFGTPRRDDLHFVVLERSLAAAQAAD
jgi:ribosomal protein S18 acetylase RimI-like enzyme